ncbi:unnamed protein product [Ectocarpus sp. CCAP 1310/34]|nr:unnamed protein product [Ectocarpus sp. CCAP 1310/34]
MAPKAEWRLFVPTVDFHRVPAEAREMSSLVDHVDPDARTDVYIKADADVGVKRRGGGGLEFKALKQRQTLGGGVGPGAAETFQKIKLGDGATPTEVIEHLRKQAGKGEGAVSEGLEALMSTPLEVTVKKSVRKTTVTTREGKASFEVTEVSVSFPEMPETYPKNWTTFCVEGKMTSIEAFLGSKGKPLVALLSLRGALQVGYPHFVQMISTQ